MTAPQMTVAYELQALGITCSYRIISRRFQRLKHVSLWPLVVLLVLTPVALTAILDRFGISVPTPVMMGIWVLGGAGIGAVETSNRKRARAAILQSPFLTGAMTISLDAECFTIGNANYRCDIFWRPEFEVLIGAHGLMLMIAPFEYYTIPANAFDDAAAQSAFVAAFEAHVAAAIGVPA